ncbi:RNA polymerase sigma factor SigJ [Pseudoduganella sp. UC29_106]|uniref:RNA polymerase sigma factor SigJ n=1 Tax=Pseudoduganella sp. UC29_106 TaxID=3374553 RepID=UPI0037572174
MSQTDAEVFAAHRKRLFSIAYRMLGVRADAEDIVQDAWLRWHGSDRTGVLSVEAWLVTVTTRLAIDRLRALKAEREAYSGFWLPEPIVEMDEHTPESQAEMASDLSMAFMWVLERLSPEERAAFLMRQVFDYEYAEVAEMLGKSEAACRQMVSRASERVQQEKVRFEVRREDHRNILQRFVAAAHSGQQDAIRAFISDDMQFVGDGGGKVPSYPYIVRDPDMIAELYAKFSKSGKTRYELVLLNGQPGLLRYIGSKLESIQCLETDGERITGFYVIRNPDKLAKLASSSGAVR